jgi:hypothetical protein
VLLGPAQIHAQQHLGPVLGLGATRTGLDIEIGIVGVEFAVEHAAELEPCHALLRRAEIGLEGGDGSGVVLLGRDIEQLVGLADRRGAAIDFTDRFGEPSALAVEFFRAVRLVPDFRLREFALEFR